jgi:MFS family permease
MKGIKSATDESPTPSHGNTIPRNLWMATLLIASQSFLYGYVMVALNPCLVTGAGNDGAACYNGDDNNADGHCPPGTIYNDLDLSTIEASIANAVFVIGAWIGSLIGSSPSEAYGRRKSLLANGIFFLIGGMLSASGNFVLLFLGRLISGFGVGVVSCLAPVLLSEIATIETRGTVTTMHQVRRSQI